jgi:uncharacterized protein YjgD (DUF1641 family)
MGELLAELHLVQTEKEIIRELANELTVLALVGILNQLVPQRMGDLENFLVGLIVDVHLAWPSVCVLAILSGA